MLYAIKQNTFLCFALIHNVTLRVEGFRGKTPTLLGPERIGQPPPPHVTQNALDWRHLITLENVFSLTYSQMIAQQFRQLNVYCRHLYFMTTGHEINCCVFKYRECKYEASIHIFSILTKSLLGNIRMR